MSVLRHFVLIASICTTIICIALIFSSTRVRYNTGRSDVEENEDNAAKDAVSKTVEMLEKLRGRTVFYNRVGKCGSRSLLNTVGKLPRRNNFTWVSSSDKIHDHPEPEEVFKEIRKIANLHTPSFYNRHIHYLDFKSLGYQQPIYINMVRDPISRFTSHYNYLKYGDMMSKIRYPKTDWEDINVCVQDEIGVCHAGTAFVFYIGLFFCGFDPICKIPGPERVRLAIKHIDEEYVAIGLMDEFETTLKLFEKMLPEYFEGITKEWSQHQESKFNTATKINDVLTEQSLEKLKTSLMVDELQVFEHAKKKYESLKKHYGL